MARRNRGKRRWRRKRTFTGGVVRGSSRPGLTIPAPWNSIRLTRYMSLVTDGDTCLTSKQIVLQVQQELGMPTDSPVFDIRVLRLDIWKSPVQTASNVNRIVFSPCDFSNFFAPTTRDQLSWYEAWGTAITPANIHYVWPKPLQGMVLPSTSDNISVFVVTGKKNDQYVIRISLLWRCPKPVPLDPLPAMLSVEPESMSESFGEEYDIVE